MTWDTRLNGHLRGPVTLTPVAKRLAVDMSLLILSSFNYMYLSLSRLGFEHLTFRMSGEINALTDCVIAAFEILLKGT